MACPFYLEDNSVVKKPIKQRRGHHRVAKDVAPFGEAAIRSQDHGSFLVTGIDELEKQIAAAGYDRQVANLVDDEERGASEEPQTLAQRAFAFGLCQGGDDVGERGERDALSSLHGFDRERRREMAFPGAWGPEQMDHFGTIDELQFGKCQNAIAIERRLEREVEAGERLDRRQPGHPKCSADTAIVAERQFLDQQLVERLDPGDLTLLDSPERGVEHFQRTRHLESDEAFLDAIDRRRLRVDGHDRPSDRASRLPMAW